MPGSSELFEGKKVLHETCFAGQQTHTLYNCPVGFEPFASQDSPEIFPSRVIAVSTYSTWQKGQMLAVSADGEPTVSDVPHCQDSSFLTHLGLAPTCLGQMSGVVSSLLNMEDKAGVKAGRWRQSLRFC